MDAKVILQVKNLKTAFDTESGYVRAVDDVSFEVRRGKTLGIVGESGCGKSVTSLSIMRLLPKPAGIIEGGQVIFDGIDLVALPKDDMYKIRGKRISMIFQEPMTALNPVHKVGKQLGESFKLHFPKMSATEIYQESIELLKKVGIPAPEQRINEFPHQLSGGMRQRVMIAIALACKPDILIADEPTTALDVTVQAQILKLMKDLQKEMGMAIIFITHDLGVIAELCDEVVVMYAGKVAERASVEDLFAKSAHPYTKGLLSSVPRMDTVRKSKLQTIEGMVPAIKDFPKGCRFQNRCHMATEICIAQQPIEEAVGSNHGVVCHNWKEVK